MATQIGLFEDAPIISSYSRADALEDGQLVDLTETDGAKGHFKYPLACTAAVWALVERAVNNTKWMNDLAGVLHDICWMSRFGQVVDPTTRIFKVIITGTGRRRNHWLKIVCGPGDTPEPVLTIMLQSED